MIDSPQTWSGILPRDRRRQLTRDSVSAIRAGPRHAPYPWPSEHSGRHIRKRRQSCRHRRARRLFVAGELEGGGTAVRERWLSRPRVRHARAPPTWRTGRRRRACITHPAWPPTCWPPCDTCSGRGRNASPSSAGAAGGGAAAEAAVDVQRLARSIASSCSHRWRYPRPDRIKGRKLFATSRDDLGSGDKPRLPGIRAQYEKAPEPKEWLVLDGSRAWAADLRQPARRAIEEGDSAFSRGALGRAGPRSPRLSVRWPHRANWGQTRNSSFHCAMKG